MLSKIKQFLTPPIFEDEDKTRLANLLNTLLLFATVLVALYSLILPFTTPNPAPVSLFLGIIILILIVTFFLMRQGKIKMTANISIAILWIFVAGMTFFLGGIFNPSFTSLILIIFGAGFLLGTRAAVIYTILSILYSLGLLYAEMRGLLPKALSPVTPSSFWAGIVINFIAVAVFIALANRSIGRALERVRQELDERRRTESELRISEQRFRTLIVNYPDMIFVVDVPTRIITFVNRDSFLGYTRQELEDADPISFAVALDDHYLTIAHWEEMLLPDNQNLDPIEYRIISKDRQMEWVQNRKTVLSRDKVGCPVQVLITLTLTTERKQLEEQFLQAQKMEAVGRLAGGVAHDFNNLLTVIMSYAELGLKTIPNGNPARAEIKEINTVAHRAGGLTQQLLAFARKQMVEPKVIDLNKLISNLNKMLYRLIGEDIELVLSLAADLKATKVDVGQIEQVLTNLVINARDAMPQGGRLTIETTNINLTEDYARMHFDIPPGQYVMFSVSDTGIGMSDEIKAHIFEPFFSAKEAGKGTGLGLATCYGIIKQSNGHISVYSEVGEGTTFKIYLPRVKQAGERESTQKLAADIPGGNETILLAEDEAIVRDPSARILRDMGYTVLEAENGADALQILQAQNNPTLNLLISDVIMPKMGGVELAKELQALQPTLKILYISGHTDSAIFRYGMPGKGSSFLQKPFSAGALARKVRDLLDEEK
ncbi:MAG TPA: response regulator [Chloroflexi bacterium]|nr:response regulator [Chloroflexota bacterium]